MCNLQNQHPDYGIFAAAPVDLLHGSFHLRPAFPAQFVPVPGLPLVGTQQVLRENIPSQSTAEVLNSLLTQVSFPGDFGVDDQVYMGVVTGIVESSIPLQMPWRNFELLRQGLSVAPEKIPPAASGFKAQPLGILPGQRGSRYTPDRDIGSAPGKPGTDGPAFLHR